MSLQSQSFRGYYLLSTSRYAIHIIFGAPSLYPLPKSLGENFASHVRGIPLHEAVQEDRLAHSVRENLRGRPL